MTESGSRTVPVLRYRWLARLAAPLLYLWVLRVATRIARGGTAPVGTANATRRDSPARRFLRERAFGHGAPNRSHPLWIHAASVGEVITALPLLEALHAREVPLLVTTATPTGAAVLEERGRGAFAHRYLPIDLPGAVQRFFKESRPRAGLIVETEIWPWLLATASSCEIPVTIVSGRLSARTVDGAARALGPVYRHVLAKVTVLARSDADAAAFRTLGARSVETIGDLKLATSPDTADPPDRPIAPPYTLAASTHDDEERQLARAWLQSAAEGLLVIAPRHPERGDALHAMLASEAASDRPIARRSQGEQPGATDRLYLADTLGELDAFYAHAEAVFVGGSLVPRGGHNPIEPARHGKAPVVGPHVENFAEAIERLSAADAAIHVGSAEEAIDRLLELRSDDEGQRLEAGRRAAEAARDSRLLDRYLAAIASTARDPLPEDD